MSEHLWEAISSPGNGGLSMGFRNQPVIVLRHLFLGRKRLIFDFPFRREFAMFEAPSLKETSGCLSPVTLVWASSTKTQ